MGTLEEKAVEQGLELVKDIISEIIIPPAKELGGLLADQVAHWRRVNTIKIVEKYRQKLSELDRKPNKLNTKSVYKFLEYSSLEENEDMQEKWANLLTNCVSEERNIDSMTFIGILNELTPHEAKYLELLFEEHKNEGYIQTVNGYSFNKETVFKYNPNPGDMTTNLLDVIVDNLIRLNLIEYYSYQGELGQLNSNLKVNDRERVLLTPLGVRLLELCTIGKGEDDQD